MIKAVIFDFDGVLVESADIKTEAFKALFSSYDHRLDEIVAYHKANMGISRYVKFKYIHEKILRIPYSDEIESELGNRFSQLVVDEVKKAPFVKGTYEFLERNHRKRMLFVASGTPQRELEEIVASKGIERFFKGIYGSPASKEEIIETIFNNYILIPDEVLFVGDALSDKKAAEKMGIRFIFRRSGNNDMEGFSFEIHDLTELENMIKRIEI